jgi:hypothetical protein
LKEFLVSDPAHALGAAVFFRLNCSEADAAAKQKMRYASRDLHAARVVA